MPMRVLIVLLLLCCAPRIVAQEPAMAPAPLITTGSVERNGNRVAYEVRHLPVSSFPDLPFPVAAQLTEMGCLIPQTYQARRPENVIHASLEAPNSFDWAVLCSRDGQVSLLVFFGSAQGRHVQLATCAETDRLQTRITSAVLGFNWGIDPASPQRVHEAQTGLSPRPPRIDHDALADSVLDRKTIYRYYSGGTWLLLDLPD